MNSTWRLLLPTRQLSNGRNETIRRWGGGWGRERDYQRLEQALVHLLFVHWILTRPEANRT